MTTDILAQRIKTIRKARKIGRSKLAKLSGVQERQLARIERGGMDDANLDMLQLEQISSALQVTHQTLIGESPLTDSDLKPMSALACTTGCCG